MDIDEQLIALLQRDGRQNYGELAEQLKASRAIVSHRMQQLMADGAIRVVAAAHPEILGIGSLAHVSIRTRGTASAVVEHLMASEAAVYVTAASGIYDVIAELRVQTQLDLYEAIAHLRTVHGVAEVSTLVYVDVAKGIFMPQEALGAELKLDAKDRELISLLQRNGRLSYRALGSRTGLSAGAARNRVKALVQNKAIRIGAVVVRQGSARHIAMGLGINVAGDGSELLSYLKSAASTEFVARTIGRFDVIATIGASSVGDLRSTTETVHRIAGVSRLETWTHLEVFKEHYARDLG